MEKLLTTVITKLVNKFENDGEYGVSILNIPNFDYQSFVSSISSDRIVEFYFLGFTNEMERTIKSQLMSSDKYECSFSIEDAEESRNSGDESRFRVLIIRRTEIEKISSLRWFPEITVDMVYDQSCRYALECAGQTNVVVESLIKALKRKAIRNILGFERVLEYLSDLVNSSSNDLPSTIRKNFYKLGLLSDLTIDQGNPSVEDFIKKIKHNYTLVEKLRNLEQAERQSITNYYATEENDKNCLRLILQFYSKKNIELLENLEISIVEKCLQVVRKKQKKDAGTKKYGKSITSSSYAAKLVFDNNFDEINQILNKLEEEVENKVYGGKREIVEIESEGSSFQIKIDPISEKISSDLISKDLYGGIIHAEVSSPGDAILSLEKYEFLPFDNNLIGHIFERLESFKKLITDGESISSALKNLLEKRSDILQFSSRLQYAPMFPILANIKIFSDYLKAYEKLLLCINNDFIKIWKIAAQEAKEVVNDIISIDNVFVNGEGKFHALPSPLNPLYLWKYVKLSEEILENRSVDDLSDNNLTDDDKKFIIRKAEDIPDPLSVMHVSTKDMGGIFLPLMGRIASIPVYSTNRQINQSDNGIDKLRQSIIRYLCLYPHAGMMFKIVVIDPPSVNEIVVMLKKLNNDKEFNIDGIDVSIYRTKESTLDWIEIDDDSMNEGMLGKYKGKRSLNFRLKIINKKTSYEKILNDFNEGNHMMILFDPNEVKAEIVNNNRQIHIHPLCIPNVYDYNPLSDKVTIRPANEGDIFSSYGNIIERINDQPIMSRHTSCIFNTPLKKDTYLEMLKKSDWLVILDQSLKSWDITLRSNSEKLYYKEDDYRSIGIYSNNSNKFILGYKNIISHLGDYVTNEEGIRSVIDSVREINDDGLLSIVSHSSNRIFDENHGKGSLGLAIAVMDYINNNPNNILVGLDTQLAREWLSERDDNQLPDLIGINIDEAIVDIVEVKTYKNSENSFQVKNGKISGHAVEQSVVLENLIREIFGREERITTVSRREILRQQVYESLFQKSIGNKGKSDLWGKLNSLFAGEFNISINQQITFVDFEGSESTCEKFDGEGEYSNKRFLLNTIGSKKIHAFLTSDDVDKILNDDYNTYESKDIYYSADVLEEKKNESPECSSNPLELPNQENRNELSPLKEESANNKKEPSLELINAPEIEDLCSRLNKFFRDFGASVHPVDPRLVKQAPRFTQFRIQLKSGESYKSIDKLKEDIKIQLEATGDIMINHVKGTKYISLDVPLATTNGPISLLENLSLLKKENNSLNILTGIKVDGDVEIFDLAKAPHLLVAGTTGSGKTIFLYSIIVSLLSQFDADEIDFLLVDPKETDFAYFEDLPNLKGNGVIIEADKAVEMLKQIYDEEVKKRTKIIREAKCRDINSFNEKNPNNKLKRLVIVIDEFSDLIMTAEGLGMRKEFEDLMLMYVQRVRSCGIHLIVATQRPSAKIVSGNIKANMPCRVSFHLISHIDSQTILDMPGAETLLGSGDMLMLQNSTEAKRLQGFYISEDDLNDFIMNYINKNETATN